MIRKWGYGDHDSILSAALVSHRLGQLPFSAYARKTSVVLLSLLWTQR